MGRTARRLVGVATVALFALTVTAGPALAGAGSNTANAKGCQKDGYKNYTTSGGQRFSNSDQCTAYAAGKGNTLTFDPLEVTPQPLSLGDLTPGTFGGGTVTIMNVGSVAVGIDSPRLPPPPRDPTINFNFTLPGAGAGKGCLLAPGESCTKDLSIAPVTIGPAQARFESAYGASDGRTGLEYIYVTANGVASGPLVVYRDMYPCPTGVGMCWGRVSGSGLLAGDPVLGGYIQSNQAGELPIGTVAPDGTFDGALDAHCGSTLQTYAHSHLADGTAITSNRAAAPC